MNVARLWGPVYCPFRRITGIPCPLCGTTTSAALVVQGRVADALRVNPIGVLVVAVASYVVITRVAAVVGGRALTRPQLPASIPRWQSVIAGGFVALCWFIRLHAPARLVGG